MNTLLTHSIRDTLQELQQLAATLPDTSRTPMQQRLDSLRQQCDSLREAVAMSVNTLTSSGDGLEGLLVLLTHAEDQPLPARQFAGLLLPLQDQIQRASNRISQTL
jgi:hypothetical protein